MSISPMNPIFFQSSPIEGCVMWRTHNGREHHIAITGDGITYEDGDAGDSRMDAILMHLDAMGDESEGDVIERRDGGDMRSCAVRLATLRG